MPVTIPQVAYDSWQSGVRSLSGFLKSITQDEEQPQRWEVLSPQYITNDGTHADLSADGSGMLIPALLVSGTGSHYYTFKFPHTWKQGTSVIPVVNWFPNAGAAGNARFDLEYRLMRPEASFPGTLLSDSITATGPGSIIVTRNEFSPVSLSGFTIEAMMHCKLSRLPGEAEDTIAEKILISDFHLLVHKDTNRGSVRKRQKWQT